MTGEAPGSQDTLIVFAPGAGAGSASAWMRAWTDRLARLGAVETLDYPYRLAGRKAPDRLPVLIAAHQQALEDARARHPGVRRVLLAGKSMGGRVGCHLALEARVDALVCLGYPLRGASGAWRDEVLLALRTPILFIQGSRDPLCPLDALAEVRARMAAPSALFVVDGGNHSLEVPRRRKSAGAGITSGPGQPLESQAEWDGRALDAIAEFLTGCVGAGRDRQ